MKTINVTDKIEPEGFIVLRAFQPGLIPYLQMRRGMGLNEAIQEAMRLGGMVYEKKSHNMVTTAGKQFIARHLSGQETVGLTYFAIGTGTNAPAISDVHLQTEHIRKPMTECYQGDVYTYSSVFLLASEGAFHLTEGGLFGGAAAGVAANSGILYCRFLMDDDNSAGVNDLTLQHTVEVK
jgi:hypothetical protein